MNPLQTELLARDRVTSALRSTASPYPLPEPRPLPPRRRPLVWGGAAVALTSRLVARVRSVAAAMPVLHGAL